MTAIFRFGNSCVLALGRLGHLWFVQIGSKRWRGFGLLTFDFSADILHMWQLQWF